VSEVANMATQDWTPVISIDKTVCAEGERFVMTCTVEGADPATFSYRYEWMTEQGTETANNGAPKKDDRLFVCVPPHRGKYLITAEVFAPDMTMRTASVWVEVVPEKRKAHTYVRPENEEPLIKVDDVSMIFNIASEQYNSLKEYFIALTKGELKFKEFRALDHISFDVGRGEAFGLVGTNGSGKSTMLKIIAGVLEASEGTCSVRGTIAPLIELGAGFDMDLTAKENIYLNGSLLGYRKEFIDEHFDEIVDFAELQNFMDMPLKNYSSGMVARIAFAIATITEPDILIVDETLSVGDFLFQQKCEKRIKELVESDNVTVLLVSHSIDLVERMCDRVCWIEKGKQRMLGPTSTVCEAYRNYSREG
jgi:ABC-2 type transport system ATP-binding protein